MRDVLPELDQWTASGDRVAVATVLAARRSAPRPPGAKLAVTEDGRITGGVSGGCVEGAVVEIAHRILAGAPPALQHYGIADADAWEVGLPCGGEIDVWVEEYQPGRFAEVARAGGRAVEVTSVTGAVPGAKLVVEADGGRSGSLGSPELDDEAARVAGELLWSDECELRGSLFFDVTAPAPRLIVFGAVDIARPLCTLARTAGFEPYVVDPRARFASAERFPDAEQVLVAWPGEAFAALGGIDPATSIVVLTHDPKLDDAALEIALRSPARFVGAMGSRRAQERRRERLLAAGLSEDELARLAAPLGLDLGGITAGETALSVLSEVVAARHGHSGGRLSVAQGRIHEVAV